MDASAGSEWPNGQADCGRAQHNSGVGWKQFKHDHSLAVPPYQEHYLFRVKSRLGSGLQGNTCCIPQLPAYHIHIMDSFLITSNN